MAAPRITYNGKTIDLPFKPNDFSMFVRPPAIVNTSLTGEIETLLHPRVDISVYAKWFITKEKHANALPLRYSLENAQHWVFSGNLWTFAMDSAKVVDTFLPSAEAAGQTVITVNSASGITNGQTYKMIGGPYYQLVTVVSQAGADITISESLNYDFPVDTIFRDQYYFPAGLRDEGAPFIELRLLEELDSTPWPARTYNLILRFMERVV